MNLLHFFMTKCSLKLSTVEVTSSYLHLWSCYAWMRLIRNLYEAEVVPIFCFPFAPMVV